MVNIFSNFLSVFTYINMKVFTFVLQIFTVDKILATITIYLKRIYILVPQIARMNS